MKYIVVTLLFALASCSTFSKTGCSTKKEKVVKKKKCSGCKTKKEEVEV